MGSERVAGSAVLIVVMGFPASGKTTLASALADVLGLVHLSSDVIRKELVGMRLTERPTDISRPEVYGAEVSRRTYLTLRRRAARTLRQGASVVLDATYGNPIERAAILRLARRIGVRCVFVLCHADDATIQARLAARAEDPHVVSDARLELWPELRAAFIEPTEISDLTTLDMTLPIAENVAHVRSVLMERAHE